MVPVPVRNDYGIETREIDTECVDVALEYPGVIARVEQYAFAAILHERRKTPIPGQCRRRSTECIVQISDSPWFFGAGLMSCCENKSGEHVACGDMAFHDSKPGTGDVSAEVLSIVMIGPEAL
jgi:hypothetical protein